MNHVEFASHFAEHSEMGIIFAVLSLIINLTLLRKYIYSLFDPLLFYTVLSSMAGAVVLYLSYFDLIRPFYFWSYITTQAAFVGAFRLIKPPAFLPAMEPLVRGLYSGPIRILYPLSVGLFVPSQLFVYSIIGLPIFLDSRLEEFATGNGFGFFSRLILVTSTISLCAAFYRLLLLHQGLRSRLVDYSVVAFCIMVAIVSGSKGGLFSVIFTASLSLYFTRKFHEVRALEQRIRGFFLVIIALSFPVALATVYIQAGIEDLDELILALLMRFFHSGEIFYMVYPRDVLAGLSEGNGFLALFYSPLGSLRLVSRADLPINLGLQAFWYHYNTDLLTGPNARHNVFGLYYFGPIFSVLFSFFLGLLFSFTRNTVYRILPSSLIGMVSYVLLMNCAIFIEQDISGQALEYFFSVFLIFPVLYFASLIIHAARGRRSNYYASRRSTVSSR